MLRRAGCSLWTSRNTENQEKSEIMNHSESWTRTQRTEISVTCDVLVKVGRYTCKYYFYSIYLLITTSFNPRMCENACTVFFSIFNTLKDLRLQTLRSVCFQFFTLFPFFIFHYPVTRFPCLLPLPTIRFIDICKCWFPVGANHNHFLPRWAGTRVANPIIRMSSIWHISERFLGQVKQWRFLILTRRDEFFLAEG